MSSPTSCLFFPPNNAIFAASFPFASLDLPAPYVRLAHLAFHPAVQDCLSQFPAIAQLECGNLAFGDVTVERIRADPQILRRLPHIHHFSRFIHEDRYPGAQDTPTQTCLPTPADAASFTEVPHGNPL